MRDFAKYIEEKKYAAVIYPEGTRSKTGVPKRFSENGFKMLTKFAPSAYIIPVSINNCWKINQHGMFPLGIGNKITFEIHEAIAPNTMEFDKLFEKVEKTIKNSVV